MMDHEEAPLGLGGAARSPLVSHASMMAGNMWLGLEEARRVGSGWGVKLLHDTLYLSARIMSIFV